jgi:hypothetical protein
VSQRGASRRPRRDEWEGQADLFSVEPDGYVLERLASLGWPAADQFPVNHTGARVRTQLRSAAQEAGSAYGVS